MEITSNWVSEEISVSSFMREHDRLHVNFDEERAIMWCRNKLLNEFRGDKRMLRTEP